MTIKVLLVDDERLIRAGLAAIINAEEDLAVVGEASDGAEVPDAVARLRPDVILMDVRMPRLDGIAAAQRIASQRIAPVVMLTAFSQRDLVESARDAGAMAYLVKPFGKSDLLPAIEMAVSRFAELQQLEAEVADLLAHARSYEKLLGDNLPLIRAMIGEIHHHGDHERQVFKAISRPLREALIGRLESAVAAGQVPAPVNPVVLADLFNGMIFTGVLRRASPHVKQEYPTTRYRIAAVDLLLRGAVGAVALP